MKERSCARELELERVFLENGTAVSEQNPTTEQGNKAPLEPGEGVADIPVAPAPEESSHASTGDSALESVVESAAAEAAATRASLSSLATELSTFDAVLQRAESLTAHTPTQLAADRRVGAAGGRDVPVSTVVHLLGLSTSSQIAILEDKVDALTQRLNYAILKLERIATDMHHASHSSTIERLDVQVNDLRALLKRILPKFGGTVDAETDAAPNQGNASGVRSRILSSGSSGSGSRAAVKAEAAPAPAETPAAPVAGTPAEAAPAAAAAPAAPVAATPGKDALEEFEQMDDATFQSAEARRIRVQTSQGVK